MTALMLIFLLIAVLNMVQVEADSKVVKAREEQVEQKNKQIKEIALLYDQLKDRLYDDLMLEFSEDLPKWKANIDHDLTVRFLEPDVMFETGKYALKPQFSKILDSFFPRYIAILSGARYHDSIEEIRIEGHTSSVWAAGTASDEAYYKNMELSQSRTRTTLQYALTLPQVLNQKAWLIAHLTANGLSSSRLRFKADGMEDKENSQRVEFKVRTNADEKIRQIIRAASQ